MIDISLQRDGQMLHPFSPEDAEQMKAYPEGRILRAKITGAKQPRNYQQLKLFFACCQSVAENTENPKLSTKDDVYFQVRMELRWIENNRFYVSENGTVVVQLKSLGYANCDQPQAQDFITRGIELMAKWLGVKADVLKRNVE